MNALDFELVRKFPHYYTTKIYYPSNNGKIPPLRRFPANSFSVPASPFMTEKALLAWEQCAPKPYSYTRRGQRGCSQLDLSGIWVPNSKTMSWRNVFLAGA